MLAFARGIGEFGATILFAGNVQGVTQTLTLAVYEQLEADFDVALSISILLVVHERRRAALLQAPLALAQLELDISVPLRAFSVDVALTVAAETVALVGPSGAGKTTVLRSVAGLHRPGSGRIALGQDVWFDSARRIDRAPDRRSVGLVFQEYALFPHMSVRANVAFGGGERADELLGRLGIAHLAKEKPGRLSGGERQRVAVARALARDPSVLLLDEPLSALDAHTRAEVREQLAGLLAELAIPALVVTHDFADAAALAQRVGVVLEGRLRQIGTPAELLARPADRFVASLTGGNLLTGDARPLAAGSEVRLTGGATIRSSERAEGRVGVAIHPWDVHVARDGAAGRDQRRGRHRRRDDAPRRPLPRAHRGAARRAALRAGRDARAGDHGVRRLRTRGRPPHPGRAGVIRPAGRRVRAARARRSPRAARRAPCRARRSRRATGPARAAS